MTRLGTTDIRKRPLAIRVVISQGTRQPADPVEIHNTGRGRRKSPEIVRKFVIYDRIWHVFDQGWGGVG